MPLRRIRNQSPQLTFAFFLVAPMVFLGVSTLVAYQNFQKAAENQEWVVHTQEVLTELEGSYGALSDAVSAQRGFLIDASPEFEREFAEKRVVALNRLAKVRELVSDTPAQIVDVERLRDAAREKLQDASQVIKARKERGVAGIERFRSPMTRESLARVRKLILELTAKEEILLARRSQETQVSSQTAFTTLWVNLLAGLSLSGLLWATSARYRQLQQESDEAERRYTEELEDKVLERTAELNATNAELEAFSYSVSHDLRAPIRAMSGYASMLEEDHGEKLDPDALDSLGRIKVAASKMSFLIDGLLRLSRITRSEMQEGPVSLSSIAEEVVSDLRAKEPGVQAEIKIAKGITVAGDAQMLRILMENLIRNSWKYSSKAEKVRIEFGALPRTDPAVFFVSDAGAGFDMEYSGKLFEPFQRLHSDREFEGTGIGLAICKRIVNRHGGRIWAEGKVGRGAKFFFTLEADPAELRDQLGEVMAQAGSLRSR